MRNELLVLLAVFAAGAAAAQEGSGSNIRQVVTSTRWGGTEFEGSEYRQAVSDAAELAQQNQLDAAWAKLKPVLAYCDSKTDTPSTQYLSVASKEEAEEAVAAHSGKTVLKLIDSACPSAYRNAGFLSVAAKDSEHALAYLHRAENLAPTYAGALVEHAYLLREMGDYPHSTELYRKALAIAEKYPSSANSKPLALRGIGFNLTELGDLDGAQKAYEDSLAVDPDNALAKNELAYIAQLRAQKK
jgi:tetratricopeptide (TPR) repeat protein